MEREREDNRRWICTLGGIICIVVALVLIALFLIQGNKKITNTGGDVTRTESMTCSADGLLYPFFKYDNAKRKTLKINIVLNDNKLDTISLVTNLYYDSAEQIEQSSAENHAAMNLSFYANSLVADSFDAHFSSLEDAMQMTLYAKAKDLNGVNAKYFLIETVSGYTKGTLENNYTNQGLSCVIKEKE